VFYWIVKNLVLGPILLRVFRPWLKGVENVPVSGAAILASNHLSFIDSVFLPLVLRRPVVFLAKSEYFTGRGFKGWLVRQFFLASGQLPIDRSGGKASEDALFTGVNVLSEGKLLGIYPEGTRSPDGRIYRGRTGIARMALESGVPVIPVAMIDTEKVMPIGVKIPKVQRIGIVFGSPLDFSRFAGYENDRFVLRAITDEIMHELVGLSGQEYVDEYASIRRARQPVS
jgi:1-acyl-sn-glycerol-3-phosphate acyltransferase